VPVTVTVKNPADPPQDSEDVPEPPMLVGVRVQVRPVDGLMVKVRLTT